MQDRGAEKPTTHPRIKTDADVAEDLAHLEMQRDFFLANSELSLVPNDEFGEAWRKAEVEFAIQRSLQEE